MPRAAFDAETHMPQVRRMFARGSSIHTIAEHFGCADSTIRKYLRLAGVPARGLAAQRAIDMQRRAKRMLEVILGRCRREEDGCLIWQGGKTQAGYGGVYFHGRYHRVHRAVYELIHGPLPDTMAVYHPECGRRDCCEPKHLAAGTRTDVLLAASARGRLPTGQRASIAQRLGRARRGLPVRPLSPMRIGLP
jgi:transposase-like protein